jgi:hypothetical protein
LEDSTVTHGMCRARAEQFFSQADVLSFPEPLPTNQEAEPDTLALGCRAN